MGDGVAERTLFPCAFSIDMYPLPVTCAFGELIDSRLVNINPIRFPKALTNKIRDVSERNFRHNDQHLSSCL